MQNEKVCCPKCGNDQISANKKGWSLTTGMIGSGKVIITCLKCGNKFKPGQGVMIKPGDDVKKRLEENKLSPGCQGIVIGIVGLVAIIVFYHC